MKTNKLLFVDAKREIHIIFFLGAGIQNSISSTDYFYFLLPGVKIGIIIKPCLKGVKGVNGVLYASLCNRY